MQVDELLIIYTVHIIQQFKSKWGRPTCYVLQPARSWRQAFFAELCKSKILHKNRHTANSYIVGVQVM